VEPGWVVGRQPLVRPAEREPVAKEAVGQPPVVEEISARKGRQECAEAVDGDRKDDQSKEGPADPIGGAASPVCSRVQPGLRLSPLILPGARRTSGPPAGRWPSLLTVVRRRCLEGD
jgi:hypothetical protein